MIRQPVKIGSITAAASAMVDLNVPVAHGGTICGIFMQCFDGSGDASPVANVKSAITKINLSVTHNTQGGFPLLNDVTPTFLYTRELLFTGTRGLSANSTGVLHYDPSAAARAGEQAANIRNIGTMDLTDMVLRMTFAGTITNVARVDVYAEIDYNLKANLGSHVRIGKVTKPVAIGGGDVEANNLPTFDKSLGYEFLHIHSGGLTDMTISKLSVVVDNSDWKLRDVPKAIIDRGLILSDITPQTGFMTIGFAKEDNPAYYLQCGMGEFKVIPTFVAGGSAAAGTVDIWYETVKL
jgi:hypothetical protein